MVVLLLEILRGEGQEKDHSQEHFACDLKNKISTFTPKFKIKNQTSSKILKKWVKAKFCDFFFTQLLFSYHQVSYTEEHINKLFNNF